jgi:DnaJ-class molecular chaperone
MENHRDKKLSEIKNLPQKPRDTDRPMRQEQCTHCKGTGKDPHTIVPGAMVNCRACQGNGVVFDYPEYEE